MKSLRLGWSSLLAVLLFASWHHALADDGKSLIVDGDRIGQVRLGMGDEELEKLLGKPSESDAAMGRAVEVWIAKSADGRTEQTEVAVHRDAEGHHWKVTQVAVTSSFFRTRDGNSTNSDIDAIWREHPDLRYLRGDIGGKGSDLELYDSTASGVAFLIERTQPAAAGEAWGKCRAIVVHPRGQEAGTIAVGAPPEQPSGS